MHAVDRGAAVAVGYGLRADAEQAALAARQPSLQAGRPGDGARPSREMGQVLRGSDHQTERPVSRCLLVALALALPAHGQTEWHQRLLEDAKKEGAVLMYTTFPSEYVQQLIEPFEKQYGIKVNHWRARSEVLQRQK